MASDAQTKVTRPAITVLPATADDSRDVWTWRNDEQTRAMSLSHECVSWEAHCAWYQASLANPDRHLYLGHLNGQAGPGLGRLGMVRFDVDAPARVALVSINLNPRYRGQRLSAPLLRAAIDHFRAERQLDLLATIRKVNLGSIKCFVDTGFVWEREDGDCNHYRRRAA